MRNRLRAVSGHLAFFIMMMLALSGAWAQDISQQPPRTGDAVNALQSAQARQVEPGLEVLEAASPLGTQITALTLSPDFFSFSVALQQHPKGERADIVGKREGAALAVNGGFFRLAADGSLKPVGLLVKNNAAFSAPWPEDGGYLAVFPEGLRIVPTGAGRPEGAVDLIQSRPVLIEPGGKWAMRRNLALQENRTIVCTRAGGEIVLVLISGAGLSLYEAGWLMRSPAWGGWFDCDAAMALDGGGSTQLYYDRNTDLSIEGETPVQNFFIARRKGS